MYVNRCCNFGGRKCDLKRSRENSKMQRPHNRNTTHVECKNKGDSTNNRRDWDHFKAIKKYVSNIPGNHEVKELHKTAIMGTAHILQKVLT